MELYNNYKYYTRINHSIVSFDLNVDEENKLAIEDFVPIKGPWITDIEAFQKINEVINSFYLDEIEYKFIELPTWLR